MIIEEYNIDRDQYLGDIEPFKTQGLPTDSFIFKELPGLGATECELRYSRHSIIVEMNVPVITGKCAKNKNIFGIIEGVSTEMVTEYLASAVQYKKLMVTPESFYKIKDAVADTDFDLYTDFFLLFDECEKIIQDVHYRADITLPTDDFFMFNNKAFVSATPILPSDPRFTQQQFKIVKIVPSFKYSQPLQLRVTNNVFTSLNGFIKKNPRDNYFIFFNTTDNIADYIKKNKIEADSMVFCSKDSSKKLRLNGFKNVSTKIKAFKKFSFFTSRFFSAVDIDYEMFQCDPTIIMVTDVIFALHSKIDALTEAVQIQGRFRQPLGQIIKREIIHITNLNEELTSMNREEVLSYLKECHIVYKVIDRYFASSTSSTAKDTLRQMLARIDYAKFLYPNTRDRNYYMVDNMINDERVNGDYQCYKNIVQAYAGSKHFQLDTEPIAEVYSYTDKDRLKVRPKNLPLKNLKKILTEKLIELHKSKHELTDFSYNMELTTLQFDFADQMIPINKYGIDNAWKLQFDITAIESALRNNSSKQDFFGMMTYVHRKFKVGTAYETIQIESILKAGLKINKIHGTKPTVGYLRKFAHLSDTKNRVLIRKEANGKEIRGYRILKFKDNPY